MRFLVYLLTLFFVGTAVAQNPTILQGNYITNVFGQSNFILNPNAQTNVANVTVSSATVTRSTTTPLVATSEFNITTSTSTGYADWTTRTFDAGMKNQNCEARFTYRGFAVATTTAQIVQGSNTVAQLTLTPSTDPRIASINFPCGDLTNLTTFRIAQTTANMTGTNEIGGIYVGLATNQANVAQAESVVNANGNSGQSIPNSATPTKVIFNSETFDQFGEYDTSTGVFTAKRAGRYQVYANVTFGGVGSLPASADNYLIIRKNTTEISTCIFSNPNITMYLTAQCQTDIDLSVGDSTSIDVVQQTGASRTLSTFAPYNRFIIKRFPTSSELVVTPERQNTFGGVSYAGNTDFTGTSTSAANISASNFGTATFHGKAVANGTGSCGGSSTDYGFCLENVPPGTYQIAANFQGLIVSTVAPASRFCSYNIKVTTSGGTEDVATNIVYANSSSSNNAGTPSVGILKLTSQQSYVRLNVQYASGSGDTCLVRSSTSSNAPSKPSLQFSPLDQPSNSALYVQGPVKAAATGAAIPSGYVFNNFYGSQYGGSYVNNTWLSLASTTLAPGLWQVEAACMMRNNTTSTTTGWNFAALSISDNNTDQGTDTNPHSYQYRQPSATGIGQYDFINAKRVIYTTTTTNRYLNIYSSWTGGGTPTYNCQFFVMRLN